MDPIKVPVDLTDLDVAIEKANRLLLLLAEAKDLIGSLSVWNNQNPNC